MISLPPPPDYTLEDRLVRAPTAALLPEGRVPGVTIERRADLEAVEALAQWQILIAPEGGCAVELLGEVIALGPLDAIAIPPGTPSQRRGLRVALRIAGDGPVTRPVVTRYATLRPVAEQPLMRAIPRAFRDVLSPRELRLVVGPRGHRKGVRYGATGPDRFLITYAGGPAGTGPALHVHTLSHEIFVGLRGRTKICWGEDGENGVEIGPLDAIAIPPGVNRSFTFVDGPGLIAAMVAGCNDELEDIVWLPPVRADLAERVPRIVLAAAERWVLRFGIREPSGAGKKASPA